MKVWLLRLLPAGALAIGVCLCLQFDNDIAAQPAVQVTDSKDIEILGHGPIHEAFAQPASPTLESTAAIGKRPPEPVEELPPEVKPEGDNVVWIPGYWAFDGEREDFVWVTGFWRNVPPNRVWVGGYWATAGTDYRWVPGYWSEPTTTQVYYPPPPEVIIESPPPAPDANSYYVAGTWVYRDTRFLWRPGFWTPFRPGWLWTQPRYSWTPGGYIFVDGYWDHDFNNRGVLFAPAYFGPRYFGANRFYQPSFALATDRLYLSLFVRPGAGAYYFGDYYAPRYAGLGYTPWVDYRYRGRYADPAWSQYAWQNRGTPRFEAQTREMYASRRSGESPAPPRRIDSQSDAKANAQAKNNNVQTVNLVMPINQMQKGNNIKFKSVDKEELQVIRRNAAETRTLTNTRLGIEGKVDAKASRQQPVKANFELPQTAAGKTQKAPPPPVLVPEADPKTALPKTKDPSDPRAVPVAPKGKDKDIPPTQKTDPTPKTSAPPIPPQPKVEPQPKGQPKSVPIPPVQPKLDPKVNPQPKVPTPPVVDPKPAPLPKETPLPKIQPSIEPLPKAPPTRVEPNVTPTPTPQPKAPPVRVAPKGSPAPPPKAAPLPSAPVPSQPSPPPPTPRVERPVAPPTAPVRPEPPKGKGKEKD